MDSVKIIDETEDNFWIGEIPNDAITIEFNCDKLYSEIQKALSIIAPKKQPV